MNRFLVVTAALAGTVVVLGVAGCSSSSGGGSSAAGKLAPATHGDVGAAPARLPAADAAAAGAGTSGGAASTAGGSGASAVDTTDITSLALIRTASLTVRIAKSAGVAAAANAADQIATEVGGSVYSDDRTAGKHASAQLTLKVPPQSLPTVLTRLAALGTEISRSSSTQDVTTKVADVNSRVTSAQQSLARLRALYGSATKVGQVIEIESEITERESDLESLEAQQRALSDETSLATVNLSLTTRVQHTPPPPKHHPRSGFLGGLSHGWHAFTASVTAVVTALGAVLPFLVIVLLVAALVWRGRGRRRSRPAHPTEPSVAP